MPYRILKYLLIFLTVAAAPAGFAGKPEDWTENEVGLAAPYCIDTMGFRYGDATTNTSPRAKHWVSLMGLSFWSMHHYCWALINLARAERSTTPPLVREHLRRTAADDMRYVISNAKPGFIMLPEVYTRLGSTYLLLKEERKAALAFRAAMDAKPDYWPPYVRWADYQIFKGKSREEIRATLREGLRHVPDSKALRKLWAEHGGGPLPEPAVAMSKKDSEDKASVTDDSAGKGIGEASAEAAANR